ncbi:hypothetical protein HJG60_011676 [Phyllostomus discolor]|uniref:Uncharacterized protein n=1 Tax=Phyllostomus discolor TaxID=89673 RepID=A0A833ZU45_9CHIR|nr:hypothetical protein HJG60_011676 [Phyllostomus discolor]
MRLPCTQGVSAGYQFLFLVGTPGFQSQFEDDPTLWSGSRHRPRDRGSRRPTAALYLSIFKLSMGKLSSFNLMICQRQRETALWFHLLMHSWVASCMCLDWGSNPQLWPIGMTLEPTELAVQGQNFSYGKSCCIYVLRNTCILIHVLAAQPRRATNTGRVQ